MLYLNNKTRMQVVRFNYHAMSILMTILMVVSQSAQSKLVDYHLTIEEKPIAGFRAYPISKITVNGSIPGPTLVFTEGDDAVIHVTNKLKVDTSVHWHGLLLPGYMDGVPGLNGFMGIKPGETFSYQFKIRQQGTYWYHAHSMGQEQDGHYGSIIIHPSEKDNIEAEREYVVLLSELTAESSSNILSNLKMSSDYYQYHRLTLGDFFSEIRKKGVLQAFKNASEWGKMRMLPTDLSDVSGYTFLINGKSPNQNWTGIFKLGERLRLRFINASAMSFYDVRIPGLKMTVVQADGQPVEPVEIDEFRFGVAETYDVIVTPLDSIAYSIVAEPIDRTGFAVATLAPALGMKNEMPLQRPRTLLTMSDMGMDHGVHGMGHEMDHKMDQGTHMQSHSNTSQDSVSGWEQAGTPLHHKQLQYADLKFLNQQEDIREPSREIVIRLGGNMERYIWTLNGTKYEDSLPIMLNYNERIRLKFINETMMAHPMHLHGMFVQLENGQTASKLPNKHTIIVPPGKSLSVLLTANELGEWAFHCHLLYHMMSGMMKNVVVAKVPVIRQGNIESTRREEGSGHAH